MKDKKAYVIACAVLALDLKRIAGSLELDLGTRFLPGGLHNNPDKLRQKLQDAIDELDHDSVARKIGILGFQLPLAVGHVSE